MKNETIKQDNIIDKKQDNIIDKKQDNIIDKKQDNIIDKKHRILYIDVMRVISIFLVVVIHVSSYVYNKYGSIDMSWWWVGNAINSISRWSVPIMIMVSGILLLDPNKEYSIRIFFKKRFNKVAIPLIFWSIVYIFWKIYKEKMSIDDPTQLLIAIVNIIQKPAYTHLWFIYTILGLYLLTPILRVYIKNVDLDNIKYFLIIWIMTNGIFAFAKELIGIRIGIELYFFTGYIGYYILGYYLINTKLNKREKILLYLATLISFIVTMVWTAILTGNKGSFDYDIVEYLNLNVIIMSIGTFIFLKNIDWDKILLNNQRLYNFILEISSLSFGIYLVHLMILQMLARIKIDAGLFNPIISIPIVSIIVTTISYIIIKLMKKLPIINNTVP